MEVGSQKDNIVKLTEVVPVRTNPRKLVVLKISGSILLQADGSPNVEELQQMASTIRQLVSTSYHVIVVVGGGATARNYIDAATQLKATKGVMDQLGILVSRLNARVLIEAIGDDIVSAEPAESLQDVRKSLNVKPVVVLGGLQPGQSTTAVAALCAEYCHASTMICSSNVDGVYTADPNKDPSARKLPKVSFSKLRDLTTSIENTSPGYRIMDGAALTILERSKIPVQILLGNSQNILKAVLGEVVGTIVGDD